MLSRLCAPRKLEVRGDWRFVYAKNWCLPVCHSVGTHRSELQDVSKKGRREVPVFQSVLQSSSLSNAIKQSPSWKKKIFSRVVKKILRTLWEAQFHCRIYKSPLPVPVTSHIKLVHTIVTGFRSTHFNIILQCAPRLSEWPVSLRFPHQTSACTSPLFRTCDMSSQSHSS